MITTPNRESAALEHSFSAAPGYYEAHAEAQREAATRLLDHPYPLGEELAPGPVLELGCGTGFLSRELLRRFPAREFHLTDLSPAMLEQCREALERSLAPSPWQTQSGPEEPRPSLTFRRLDATSVEEEGPRWALIAGSFVAQWFPEPAETLLRWSRCLLPGGRLRVSLPTGGSFPEWRGAAARAGVPYRGHPLPDGAELIQALREGGGRVRYEWSWVSDLHPSPLALLKHLRRLGAAPRTLPPVGAGEIRRLLRFWDGGGATQATYEVLTLDLEGRPE